MIEQNFGIKELSEVVLRAKTPMVFGSRRLEEEEPVLFFENISMALISERNSVIVARGGWSNMPRVIWEDRSEITFSLTEGVMSSISLGILLSANMLEKKENSSILVPKREGPYELDNKESFCLSHMPVFPPKKKVFIYEYDKDNIQKKVYGDILEIKKDIFGNDIPRIKIREADINKKYMVDYYYEYNDEALFYLLQKDRFNGLFTLEGKFYSKDENDGLNYTNLIYMPKVRIVSDINLRLGEKASPTTSVFNIVGMPEGTDDSDNLILKITRLNSDVDADI